MVAIQKRIACILLNNCSEMVSICRSGRPGRDGLFSLAIRDPEGRSYRNRDKADRRSVIRNAYLEVAGKTSQRRQVVGAFVGTRISAMLL